MPDRARAARSERGTQARVAVVGGGIAGLATAWYLTRDATVDVTLLEAGTRAGGKIRTDDMGGTPVEGGPDTFLARVPWAVDLCRELGLADDLIPPASGQAYVWARGALQPFPEGLVLGVPTTFAPLLRSGILSPAGVARAALDVTLPRHPFPYDPSVADVVRSRMGSEVLDRLVDPLIGGINAGSSDRLSLRATAPQLADALDHHRSLALGLRRQQKAQATSGPVFLGLRGGMQRLVDRLQESLPGIRTEVRVKRVVSQPGGRYRLECQPGADVSADAVVVAVPAYAAADLLPTAASNLRRIDYASVVVATLGYSPDAVGRDLDGSGFLVPRSEEWLTTACTWSTSKWPHLKKTGLTLLRASAGRAGDGRAMELEDVALVERLHGELDRVLGLSERPVTALVSRWPRAFPQYDPGHEARVAHIERSLPPGVFATGAAYRGLGIAACVREAKATAARVHEFL